MNVFCPMHGLDRDVGKPATDPSLHVSFDDECDTPTTLAALLDKLLKPETVLNSSCPGCEAHITDQRAVYTQVRGRPPVSLKSVTRHQEPSSTRSAALAFVVSHEEKREE